MGGCEGWRMGGLEGVKGGGERISCKFHITTKSLVRIHFVT